MGFWQYKNLTQIIFFVPIVILLLAYQNCAPLGSFKKAGKNSSGSLESGAIIQWKSEDPTVFDTTAQLIYGSQKVAIENTSTVAANDLAFETEGAGFSNGGGCKTIPGRSSCEVTLGFRPGNWGAFTGTLKVLSKGKTIISRSIRGDSKPRMLEYGQDLLNPLDTNSARNLTQNYLDSNIVGKPFHGFVVRTQEFWLLMSKSHRHTFEQFQARLDVLKNINYRQFKNNFLGVGAHNMVGGQAIPDWFESDEVWQNGPINNFKVMAQVAKAAGFRGLMMDPEDYHEWGSNLALWDYNTRPLRGQYTYQQYVAKVRERGQQFMRAMNSVFPGMAFLTYACYDPFYSGQGYELLVPFCDGMVLAADENTSIHVISENGFTVSDAAGVRSVINAIKQNTQAKATDPVKAAKHVRAGIGLWYTSQSSSAWNGMLQAAAESTEGYVWIYTENSGYFGTPRQWWPSSNIPGDIFQTTMNVFNFMNR